MFYREGDIEKTLLRLGIDSTQRRSELLATCPMHKYRVGKEDSNPSWSINSETGAHHCFSCGYKGNVLTLISDLLEYGDLEKAKQWLRSNVDVDWTLVSKQLEEAKKTYIHLPKLVPMSEARLAIFGDVPEWAEKARGLSNEACKHYGIRWRESDSTWILPIRSADGKLLGWQEKGQLSRRFFNRPPGIPKSKTLFGLNVWQPGQMIIVESPLDAVKLKSLNIPGAVATCGAIVSNEQLELMRRADLLIIAMDNDSAGNKATQFLLQSFRRLGLEGWFFNYGNSDKKDIGDMSEDDIDWGFENAIHCVRGGSILK